MKSPRVYRWLTLLVAILACGAGCTEPGANQQAADRPAVVSTTRVTRGALATHIAATGTLVPCRESFLAPKVDGRIETFFADEGDFVNADAPLMQLEKERFAIALREAEATRDERRAQVRNLERTFARTRSLYDKGVTDKQLFDDTRTELELARARADVAAARLDRARKDLQDATLRAPFAGYVVERRMNIGEAINAPSGEYVFHIVDTATMRVEVNVFETHRSALARGTAVQVTVDALPGTVFDGSIAVVNPLIEPLSRKFLVKIDIPNPAHTLEPGMFARARIPDQVRTDTLIVPAAALDERDGQPVVFGIADQAAVMRAVTPGLITHDQVEILDGLAPGEEIIVDGLYAVKDATPVIVKQTSAAAAAPAHSGPR